MTIAKAPAGAPPVLWVVVRRTGTVVADAGVRCSARAAKAEAAHWDTFNEYGTPHRVVAYVPRDTP